MQLVILKVGYLQSVFFREVVLYLECEVLLILQVLPFPFFSFLNFLYTFIGVLIKLVVGDRSGLNFFGRGERR